MARGMEGVVAAETTLSHTDSATGMVWVRGVALPDLTAQYGFEGTVALLWDEFFAESWSAATLRRTLGEARVKQSAHLAGWLDRTAGQPWFDAIEVWLALQSPQSQPADLVSGIAVAVPALVRCARDLRPIAPDPSLSTAADLLRMLHGVAPQPEIESALDTYFTVMAESGLSASSFTARVVSSTRASLKSSVLGAWCAFSGPLHGGAPGPTLDMLDAAQAAPDLDSWLEDRLRSGERLMGFGHRVFKGNDPRAEAMRLALARLGPASSRLEFAGRLEQRVAVVSERLKPGRKLPPNVEIMAAMLLDACGIPRDAFTPVFAVGRSAGWLAHAMEQQKSGRMIRPTSVYVGPPIPDV